MTDAAIPAAVGRLRRAPKPHLIVMALLFAGSLVAGYLMLPGDSERIAMLESDGKSRQALHALERRFKAGDRSQHTLFELQLLYELYGDLDNARKTLEMLAASRPRDVQVQRRLATFYKQTQNEAAYVKALRSQIELRYSEPACRELIGILRYAGDFAGEQTAIQQCRQAGYRRAEDLIRLAELVAVDGDLPQASLLLRSVDDLRRLKTEHDRIKLFGILLELDQPREAHRRAVRWLRGSRDEALALSLLEMLSDENRQDMALELARDVSMPGDSISLAVGELMLERGQIQAAKSYLRGWLEQAQFSSTEMASRFVTAALDAEDPDTALAGVRKLGITRVPQADLMALAEALVVMDRPKELEEVNAALDPEAVQGNPLLGAAMQLSKGSSEASKQLLAKVEVDQLDEWRLTLWTRLMEQTGNTSQAAATLQQLGVETEPERPPVAKASPVTQGAPPKIIRRIKRNRTLRLRPRPVTGGAPTVQMPFGFKPSDTKGSFPGGNGG